MKPRQLHKLLPKLLLSLLLSGVLCVPALVNGSEKSTASRAESTPQVPPVKQKAKPAPAQTAKAEGKTGTKAKQPRSGRYPRPGMSMKQVRKRYGEPKSVRKSKGRVKKLWPRITVWNYGTHSVYFERHLVLHTVIH